MKHEYILMKPLLNMQQEEFQGIYFQGVDGRYYDTYTTSNTSARVGDALGTASTTNKGCANWHSAYNSNWAISNAPYFRRGGVGLFSFSNSVPGNVFCGRGVVVCGEGL